MRYEIIDAYLKCTLRLLSQWFEFKT